MRMQLHADDACARDPGGSPFASESSRARPRERRAVGARPTEKSSEGSSWRLLVTRVTAPERLLPGTSHAIGKHHRGRRSAPASHPSSCQSATPGDPSPRPDGRRRGALEIGDWRDFRRPRVEDLRSCSRGYAATLTQCLPLSDSGRVERRLERPRRGSFGHRTAARSATCSPRSQAQGRLLLRWLDRKRRASLV